MKPVGAWLITAVTVCGSALISTLGTAYWNVGVSLLFVSLSLWLIVRDARQTTLHRPYLLGWLLWAAYLCRPTSLAFTLPVLVYLYVRHGGSAVRAAAAFAMGSMGFSLFSWLTYGRLLPDYYALARFDRSYQVGRVLLGHLVSPSRGWLVFSPFLALVLIGGLFLARRLRSTCYTGYAWAGWFYTWRPFPVSVTGGAGIASGRACWPTSSPQRFC